LAPLLNTILSLDFPDNELTAQMGEEGRAESTRKLLLGLLQADGNRPRALVVEDAHWLDSASWKLAPIPSVLPWWVRAASDPAVVLAATVAALATWRIEALIRLPQTLRRISSTVRAAGLTAPYP